MADATWFLIRSSHAIRFYSRANAPKALCGKWGKVNEPTFATMPEGKSCESCLRILAREGDA